MKREYGKSFEGISIYAEVNKWSSEYHVSKNREVLSTKQADEKGSKNMWSKYCSDTFSQFAH